MLALAPLSEGTSEALTQRWARLTNVEPPRGLAGALLGLSELITDLGDQIVALDINPLLVVGDRVIAVDALIQRRT